MDDYCKTAPRFGGRSVVANGGVVRKLRGPVKRIQFGFLNGCDMDAVSVEEGGYFVGFVEDTVCV